MNKNNNNNLIIFFIFDVEREKIKINSIKNRKINSIIFRRRDKKNYNNKSINKKNIKLKKKNFDEKKFNNMSNFKKFFDFDDNFTKKKLLKRKKIVLIAISTKRKRNCSKHKLSLKFF